MPSSDSSILLLGLGLSCFSATLATIYEFKPQGISLSATFLCVISYVLALAMQLIPRKGWLGKFLNPHAFNAKYVLHNCDVRCQREDLLTFGSEGNMPPS